MDTDNLVNFAFIKWIINFCHNDYNFTFKIFSDFLIKFNVDRVTSVFNQVITWKFEGVNISSNDSFNFMV
jgi:hypothetical protein